MFARFFFMGAHLLRTTKVKRSYLVLPLALGSILLHHKNIFQNNEATTQNTVSVA